MKGFHFRLARVLRVRRLEEQVARADYLERQREARRADDLTERSIGEVRRVESELAERLSSGRQAPSKVIQEHACIDGMQRFSARRAERARTLALQAEAAREPWAQARTGVRALETLEGKQRDRFRTEEERHANRDLDETATRRARKNTGALLGDRSATRGKADPT